MERNDRSKSLHFPQLLCHHPSWLHLYTLSFLGEHRGLALVGPASPPSAPHRTRHSHHQDIFLPTNHIASTDSKQHGQRNDIIFFFKVPRSVFSKDLGAVCTMEAVAPGPGDCLTWEGGGREDCSDFCLGQQDTRKGVHGDGGCGMGSKFRSKADEFLLGLEESWRRPGGDIQFLLGLKGLWLQG